MHRPPIYIKLFSLLRQYESIPSDPDDRNTQFGKSKLVSLEVKWLKDKDKLSDVLKVKDLFDYYLHVRL